MTWRIGADKIICTLLAFLRAVSQVPGYVFGESFARNGGNTSEGMVHWASPQTRPPSFRRQTQWPDIDCEVYTVGGQRQHSVHVPGERSTLLEQAASHDFSRLLQGHCGQTRRIQRVQESPASGRKFALQYPATLHVDTKEGSRRFDSPKVGNYPSWPGTWSNSAPSHFVSVGIDVPVFSFSFSIHGVMWVKWPLDHWSVEFILKVSPYFSDITFGRLPRFVLAILLTDFWTVKIHIVQCSGFAQFVNGYAPQFNLWLLPLVFLSGFCFSFLYVQGSLNPENKTWNLLTTTVIHFGAM